MFSSAVRVGTRLNDWKIKPIRFRRNSVSARSVNRERFADPTTTSPLVSRSRAARQCISVDLPDPDGPMMAVNWPRLNETEMPSSARTAVSPVP
jgi:hypothetical protein